MPASKSKILDKIPEEEILSPVEKIWHYNGKDYAISPMPDSSYMHVADQLQTIADAFRNVAGAFSAGLTGADFLPLLPAIAKALIPCQSKLIATSTGIPIETVEKIPMVAKMQCLLLIVQAEHVAELQESFMMLVKEFGASTPAKDNNPESGSPVN